MQMIERLRYAISMRHVLKSSVTKSSPPDVQLKYLCRISEYLLAHGYM